MQIKCSCYWPEEIDQELDAGHGLTVSLDEEQIFAEYKIKKLTLTNVSN